MIGRLTGGGVSVLMTVEITESFTEIKFSPHAISFLAQNIIFLRYVELEGRLRRVLAVVKMRGSGHSHDLREFDLTEHGLRVLGSFGRYQGVLTGIASPLPDPAQRDRPGLDEQEQRVLDQLVQSEQLSEAELRQRTGLASEPLASSLGRLLALNYVLSVTEDGRTYYRALERPLGHSSP